MDFRIRAIKNPDNLVMQKQPEPILSVLRELTEVMRISHQHFIDAQKQRLETRQVLRQIKSSLGQKEQALKTIAEQIGKIAEKTVQALTDICNKVNTNKCYKNIEQTNAIQVLTQNQKYSPSKAEEKQKQMLKKMEQINVTPVEPRNIQIIVKTSKKNIKDSQQKMKFIKSDIANLSNKVFSVSFNMFFKERVDFDKIKAYCAQNMLGNIIQMIKYQQNSVEQIWMIDKHLSNMVLPYLKLSYPHSEQRETSSKLANLIVEKDIFNDNRFDVIYNSSIRKMTWHGLKEAAKNDSSHNTQKELMRLINDIIQLPNQIEKEQKEEKTLFESFQQDMIKTFEIILNKDLSWIINERKKKIIIAEQTSQKGEKLGSVAGLLQIIQKKLNQLQNNQQLAVNAQKQMLEYKEKVKSYTKYKIGRKISANSKLYTQKQIERGKLIIKDSSIRRIITKWIQSIQQVFQNPAEFTILRNQLLRLDDGTQNNNEGLKNKQILFNLIKNQAKQVKFNFDEIKKNLYQVFRQSIINHECQLFDSEFCSQRQASIGNVSTILSRATETYIIKYLVTLINSLKKVEKEYYIEAIKFNKSQNQTKPLLVNFKLGDLMRCQLSSKENEVVTIYNFLMMLCEQIPQKFELVRVKNRFDGPNKDILINIWYHKMVMVEIQLAIKNQSPFLECSDKYSHFIYELRRDILGPISEMVSVWNKFSPKVQFFEKQYRVQLRNNISIKNIQNKCKGDKHFFMKKIQKIGLPFWCANCKVFQLSEQKEIKCKHCLIRICLMCNNREEISKQFSNKKIDVHLTKMQKGHLMKGVQMKSKQIKLHFFMEFMGKMHIFSFRYDKNEFSEIQSTYEQSNEPSENESKFKYFLNNNYIISGAPLNIDKQRLLSSIFTNFWKNKFVEIANKRKNTFKIIFSSTPPLAEDLKAQIVQNVLNINLRENKKNHLAIEKLSILQSQIKQINIIKGFRNLKQLNIRSNKVRTFQGIPYLKDLQEIDLGKNEIQSLKGFPLFKNLKKIYLRQNKITEFYGIPYLDLLEQINIGVNQLKSMKGLPLLNKLKKIIIQQNLISTLQEFPQLPELQQMDLEGNKLQSFKGLPLLATLKKINARQNKIITFQGFPQLPLLKQIDIGRNKLQSLKGLPLLLNLKYAYLQYNNISQLQGIEKLPQLQYINLGMNQLQNLKGFPSLIHLKKLYVYANKIRTIQGTPQFPVLQQLDLGRNKIQSLKGFPILVKLKKINIMQNILQTLKGIPELPILQEMDLGGNQIQSCQGLSMLPKLKKMNLQQNILRTFEGIPQLPLLEQINIRGNQLQSFQGLPLLPKLKKINAQQNEIYQLSNIPELAMLQELDISKNSLQSLSGLPLLNNLKRISLQQNNIRTFQGISQLSLLEQINFGYNSLNSFKGLPSLINLKIMNLQQNQIDALSDIPELPLLEEIDLRNNPIDSDPKIQEKLYSMFPCLKAQT